MGWGQQAWSVLFGFTWSSIHHLVVRMEVLLGLDAIGASWMQKKEGTSGALEMLPGGSDIITCIQGCSRSFQGE